MEKNQKNASAFGLLILPENGEKVGIIVRTLNPEKKLVLDPTKEPTILSISVSDETKQKGMLPPWVEEF